MPQSYFTEGGLGCVEVVRIRAPHRMICFWCRRDVAPGDPCDTYPGSPAYRDSRRTACFTCTHLLGASAQQIWAGTEDARSWYTTPQLLTDWCHDLLAGRTPLPEGYGEWIRDKAASYLDHVDDLVDWDRPRYTLQQCLHYPPTP